MSLSLLFNRLQYKFKLTLLFNNTVEIIVNFRDFGPSAICHCSGTDYMYYITIKYCIKI